MKRTNRSIIVVFFTFFLVFIVLTSNVFLVSIVGVHFNSGVSIDDYADNISIYKETLPARRGFVYDRNKEIIAQDTSTYTIYAVLDKNRQNTNHQPAYVDDVEATAIALAPLLNISEEELIAYMSTPNVYQVEFGRKGNSLSQSIKDKISALNLNGIEFNENNGRIYPNGVFASHMIGFAQYDASMRKVTGRTGLELAYNEYLSGKDGYIEYQKNGNTSYQLIGTQSISAPAENGNDIYLTLDSSVQTILQNGLSEALEFFESELAWGVIMEVKTGKILGYASYPSYDLNKKDVQSYVDIPLSYAFEPGSTMKTFLMAAAIEKGIYDGNKTYHSGLYHVGQNGGNLNRLNNKNSLNYIGTIQDANNGKGWGTISLDEGFIRSSNTAMVTIFNDYNLQSEYRDMLSRFGFFQNIDFDLPGEVVGNINYDYGMEKITTTFGQGLSVNTLQMLQAYSALYNKGVMVKPYVIESIRDSYDDSIIYQGKIEQVGQPISEKTADKILDLMTQVFENDTYGSGRFYKIPEVKMAGKTGTAEISSSGSYGEGAGQHLYSIVAAAPADDPEIMFYYALRKANTKNVHTMTSYFKQIFRSVLMYLDIHDMEEINNSSQLEEALFTKQSIDDYLNTDVLKAKAMVEAKGFDVVIIGNGSDVINQYPLKNTQTFNSQKVFLYTGNNKIIMPDMQGWSRKDVIAFWSMTNIPFQSIGDGYVSEQNINPNEEISQLDLIQLVFK